MFETLSDIEQQLYSTFRQVRPDPDYVYRLRNRLLTDPGVMLEERPKMAAFAIVSLSLFFGVLLIWLFRR
jgi:hypothetical protein